ncbi:MAG: DNA gyrase/topoisomerase IV subunit A [Bacteroidetes bacterium]|nr:DNA gyrase/topoisomerase IV subunit A [Bacteroidota bacterium]
MSSSESNGTTPGLHEPGHVNSVRGMFDSWWLDYASYVILDRAVPAITDGLKPVQRRILHAMREMEDGRYHKVANIIGQTMMFHPHGDQSITAALVNLGQKDLLIDTQGNWGDPRTGDSAAAARYIEARLSKFALEVLFHEKTTDWQLSYDGRRREPVAFPVKFPLLLAQGVEGIAVGLSTKILPHNFCELINASIHILEGKEPVIFPDFQTGGMIDVSAYNDGKKGGKVRIRAKIEEQDKKTLVIREIPYGVTTTSLIESILKANDKGKIKIKRVIDNTAKDIEIVVELAPGVSPDVTVDALYAFTDCEISESPNACVIIEEKPVFLGVTDILHYNTEHTVQLLKAELEEKRNALMEQWHFSSLEKIFIENRIYRDIEECETWESVLDTIDKGLDPFKKKLKREVTRDDITRLTEIKIKRISKYDSFKADEELKQLDADIKQVNHHLAHLVEYTIDYFKGILKKYGTGRERKTEIRTFDTIAARSVVIANQKLYVNRADGFIGYGLKKDEYICDCSDIDDIIVFLKSGSMMVTRIEEKKFIGKDIIHVDVWKKNDERRIYNVVYADGPTGISYAKRFAVTAITRDKDYDLTKGGKGSRILYLTSNPNGESEVVTINLSPNCNAKIKTFDFDFGELAIKGRQSMGNILTRWPVKKLTRKSVGPSSFGARKIFYDAVVGRLNVEGRGQYVGAFNTNDTILVIYKDGSYEQTSHELTNRYEPDQVLLIRKYHPELVINAVYFEGEQENYFVKRFIIETQTLDKRFGFIGDHKKSKLITVSLVQEPVIEVEYAKGKTKETVTETVNLSEFMDLKGWKALGNRLTTFPVKSVKLLTAMDDVHELDEPVTTTPESGEESDEPEADPQIGLFGK